MSVPSDQGTPALRVAQNHGFRDVVSTPFRPRAGTGHHSLLAIRKPPNDSSDTTFPDPDVRRAALLFVLVLGIAPTMITAQDAQPPFATTGAFFALSVSDLAASAQWYREKLGLRVVLEPPRSTEAAVIVLEGGGLIVELLQHSAARPMTSAAPGVRASYEVHGLFKAGLIVEDFDRTIAALRARGVEIAIGPFPRTTTQRANAVVKDNAGNMIQFFGR
jgi:catechol 2,3-dioxygenase-like lactoylglutathione lyase family enzyme